MRLPFTIACRFPPTEQLLNLPVVPILVGNSNSTEGGAETYRSSVSHVVLRAVKAKIPPHSHASSQWIICECFIHKKHLQNMTSRHVPPQGLNTRKHGKIQPQRVCTFSSRSEKRQLILFSKKELIIQNQISKNYGGRRVSNMLWLY